MDYLKLTEELKKNKETNKIIELSKKNMIYFAIFVVRVAASLILCFSRKTEGDLVVGFSS
jgi:hypothetical protein